MPINTDRQQENGAASYALGFQHFPQDLAIDVNEWKIIFDPNIVTLISSGLVAVCPVIMPPTLKKLEGHIAFGLSVCLCVRVYVC